MMRTKCLFTAGALAMAPATAANLLQQEGDPAPPVQEIKEAPTPGPAMDPNVKIPAPLVEKNGRYRQDNSRLSLEERERIDAIVSQRRPDDVTLTDPSGKPIDTPIGALSIEYSEIDLHVQLDEGPDGTLWGFGGTYKASFDASGATFIPFLGSQATQNYPLHFAAPTITIAGEPLAVDGRAFPSFVDHTAVFDRQSVVERYDVRAGEIEQLFVFDELPGRGEIVVRSAVDSELVAEVRDGMLAFTGPEGGVGYSFAVAIDAAGERIAVPTAFVDGAIELRVPASFVIDATLPLTIDPILDTIDIPVDATRNDWSPDIAYDLDANRWYVVWEREFSTTDDDIWGEMYSATGNVLAGTGAYIDFTTDQWRFPSVANNRIASQFLVVAQCQDTIDTIWGRTREASSTAQGVQFQISNDPTHDNRYPEVGGDPHTLGPTYYCVVWERYWDIAVDHDVHARLVRANSTLVGSGTILIDNTGGTYDKVPSVSKSNGTPPATNQAWNITWQREFSSTDWDIRHAQLEWDGDIETPSSSLDFSGQDDRWPDSSSPLDSINSSQPREWLAVYERRFSDADDIMATSMRGGDRLIRHNLSAMIGGFSEDQDQNQPCVDSNGDAFAIAWSEQFGTGTQDFDVYVLTAYLAGDDLHIADGRTNLAFSSDFEYQVEMCSRHSAGVISDWVGVVWSDYDIGATNDRDIEGSIWEIPDWYGSDIGNNYCTQFANSTGSSAVIHASGAGFAGSEPLTLTAFRMPNNANGYFIGSPNQGNATPASSSGRVCIGGPLARFAGPGQVVNSGSDGRFSVDINTGAIPTPMPGVTFPILAGQTFHFQGWFRDGLTNNLTDGTSVLFR